MREPKLAMGSISRTRHWALAAVLLASLGPAPSRADAGLVPLAPHHAAYKLTLFKTTGNKAPAGVSGLISYDFSGSSCEGYATVFRQLTEMQPAEGESRVSEMRSTSFEDGDAKLFRFNTHTSYSGENGEDIDGKAHKAADGHVAVDLQKPSTLNTTLATALFPTEHMHRLLEAARDGKKTLSEPIYDGSETGQKVFDTFAVIGASITGASDDAAGKVESLNAVRRWPITISYFEQGKNDSQPNYIMSFELYENGVSRALKLDYGSFTLAGQLVELKLADPAKTCAVP